ncbi:hypothetical protein ACTA71_006545 [Dictyostelium dimigraforme]
MNLYNSSVSNIGSVNNNKINSDYNNDISTKGYHTSIYIDDNDLNNQIINNNNNNSNNSNNANNNINNNPKKMVINLNPSGIFIPLVNDFDEEESLMTINKMIIQTAQTTQIAIPILNNNNNNNNNNSNNLNNTTMMISEQTMTKNTTIFNNKTISFGRIGFRSIVIFLILVPYIYILNFAIFPWTVNQETERKGKIHSFLSMALVIQMLCNYYLCSTTDPGSFKDTISPSYYLLHPISSSDSNDKKWCNKCNHQKPERAHHCRYCNRCVLRMDHHCQWLQNCVGLFNQKYFVLFLFYTSISIIYFFTLLIKRSIELVTKHTMEKTLPDFDLLHLFLLGILIIILIIAGISIMALLWTQLALIGRGLTTIEYEDKKRKFQQPNVSNLYKKYDKGSIISNFSIVFGNLSFYWLLPTVPNNLKITSKKGDIFIV